MTSSSLTVSFSRIWALTMPVRPTVHLTYTLAPTPRIPPRYSMNGLAGVTVQLNTDVLPAALALPAKPIVLVAMATSPMWIIRFMVASFVRGPSRSRTCSLHRMGLTLR